MVTNEQVRLLRQRLMEGQKQTTAAATAGMSVRSARSWGTGSMPSEKRATRAWRTHPDPFVDVWSTDIEPWLIADEKGSLQATTVLDALDERHPEKYGKGLLRTLQRRMRDWRALHGPEREVFFEQEHPPGREAAFDFTCCNLLAVTILGLAFPHLLFVLRLSCSGWIHASLAFSESFEALVRGLQGALWTLGRVPEFVRSDNLSAATHELKLTGGRALNRRFQDVLDHYGLKSTRIKPGKAHENGGVEKANDLLKQALEQALVLRGSRDFGTVEAYTAFVEETVERSCNRHVHEVLDGEWPLLHTLPAAPVPSHTTFSVKVRIWSTIRVNGRTYSVPSRLIGRRVRVHQHPDHLEVFYKDTLVERMPRLRKADAVRIDYHHVIWSLVRKPGAFARYRYREELYPTLVFRQAYDALRRTHGDRADVEYVRVLHLAASTMEAPVERALAELLATGGSFDYVAVKAIASPTRSHVPDVKLPEPDLAAYDRLLGGVR
jgi:hypothetical protein